MSVFGFCNNKCKHEVYTKEEVDTKVKTNIVTNEEYATNDYINGERVYVKRVIIEALPNATSLYLDSGIPLPYTPQRIDGLYDGYPINFHYQSNLSLSHGTYIRRDEGTSVNNWVLQITTGSDKSGMSGYVDVYYTKETE